MQVVLDDYVWAARVATDLVNTAAEVWAGDEQLPDLAALTAFADEHTGPAAQSLSLVRLAARARRKDLEDVHALRTVLRDLIDHPDRSRLITGASALTSSAAGATLLADSTARGRTRWALTLQAGASIADALAMIGGIGLLGVVHNLGEQRLRSCAAPTCRGAFIDTTRPGRRRYCMPGLCGNRVNVANHRARRAVPPAGSG